jgi:hypothetical protein
MDKLQKLGDIKNVYKYLEATPYISNDKTPIAIAEIGYFPDIKNFLEGILQKHKRPGCKLLGTDGGLSIQSEYDDIGQIDLSHSDLDELQHCVVFCHNDLEPRNILVRKSSSGKYKLTGVIDWERAGFSHSLTNTVLRILILVTKTCTSVGISCSKEMHPIYYRRWSVTPSLSKL